MIRTEPLTSNIKNVILNMFDVRIESPTTSAPGLLWRPSLNGEQHYDHDEPPRRAAGAAHPGPHPGGAHRAAQGLGRPGRRPDAVDRADLAHPRRLLHDR